MTPCVLRRIALAVRRRSGAMSDKNSHRLFFRPRGPSLPAAIEIRFIAEQ